MKKRILVLCLALCLLLTGCSTGDKKAADIPGRLTIGNVNALCQDAQLLESGKELLTALSDDLLLCLALDSAAPATAEQLAAYDHIALISANGWSNTAAPSSWKPWMKPRFPTRSAPT